MDSFAQSLESLVAGAPDYRREIEDIIASHPLVAFYGCGNIFHTIARTWREHISRPIDLASDSNPAKWGTSFEGIPCVSPAELAKQKDSTVVFVTVGECFPVIDSLVQAGFPSVHTIYMYDLIAADYLAKTSRKEIANNLLSAYALFEDARSREVFQAIVNRVFRSGDKSRVMANVRDPDQYFPNDVVALTKDECFADVGAFDGDTIREFLAKTNSSFEKIFGIELNPVNFDLMNESTRNLPCSDRIRLINIGAWEDEREAFFSDGQSQCMLGGSKGTGHVAPLDTILDGECVTLLKMDIEGAEPHALKGATRLIKKQKPTLAICVYHHLSHLWELPLLIKSLVPEYQFFLRHHTNLDNETVFYAKIAK